jgi:surface polysaccharide O-acyltransferase-like enzyme
MVFRRSREDLAARSGVNIDLNFGNKMTAYLSKTSFGVYIFHQSWIVMIGFFVLKIMDVAGEQ